MRKNQNFEMKQGDTRSLRFPIVDESDAPLLLDPGFTGYWWAAPSEATPTADVPLKKNGVAQNVSIETVGGQSVLVIGLSVANTQDLPPRDYYHEGEIRGVDGSVYTVASGRMRLFRQLVKA